MLDAITRIQDVFESWREVGSKRLPNGTELIGRATEGADEGWMHAVFPRLQRGQIDAIEVALDTPLPADLRRFYSACGGMILFGGLFRIYGLPTLRGLVHEQGLMVDDLVALNHQLDNFGWRRKDVVVFGASDWDGSVYATGMGDTATAVCRLERATGNVLGAVDSVWELVADKLYRLDEMFVR